MNILVIGLNYKTAPVEVRERFTFTESDKQRALLKMAQVKAVLECVLVATCNRTEIYAVVDNLHLATNDLKKFLAEWFAIPIDQVEPYLYVKSDDKAVNHLFRVTCGLDSMVLGETQILGQVRDSFLFAQQLKVTGTIFNTLFKQAVTLAKRAHSETSIGQNAVSVSYAAIELGKKIFGGLAGKTVLIVGAGKMSELTAKHLTANGVKEVLVANRTLERAESLAEKFSGKACPWQDLHRALVLADIVISSTGANGYVITKETVARVLKARRYRPLFLIDIAVPRDLDPAINELDNVYLYNIDDLHGIVETNLRLREKEAEKIERMIGEEWVAFKTWMNTLGVVPLIAALREKAAKIQEHSLTSIANKLPNLTDKERHIIEKHVKGLVNQLLHDPIVSIKELAAESGDEAVAMFQKMFALEGIMEEKRLAEQQKREQLRKNFQASLSLQQG